MRLGISGPHFGLILGLKTGPKIGKNLFKKWLRFLIPFLKVLELFRCLLAVFLAIPRLSWTALDSKNLEKLHVFFEIFVDAQFWALVRSCWRSWAHLGALGPILGSNWPPKLPPNCSKFGSKNAQTGPMFGLVFGPVFTNFGLPEG